MTDPGGIRPWLRPGLLGLHVLAVAAVVFCVVMGLWQMGVYDSRQEHERADRQDVPRVALAGLWGPDEPFHGRLNQRPVVVDGTFGPTDEQVWVTGRRQDGRDGVWLLAPLVVDRHDSALLVVRGWAPAATSVPPAVPDGPVSVDAVLQQGEGAGAPFDPTRRTIGSVRVPALTNELPHDLFSGFAISTSPDVAGGLALAETPERQVSWTVGARNLAYALQWWVFGLFAAFMWWRMAGEAVAAAREREAAPVA